MIIRSKGQLLRIVVVFLVMAVAGICFLFSAIRDYLRSGELLSSGERAQATITGVYDHRKGGGRYAEYTFSVHGKAYNGQADYAGGYQDRGPLTVTYLPSDPSFSAINAETKHSGARVGVLFTVVWLGILAVFGTGALISVRRRGSMR